LRPEQQGIAMSTAEFIARIFGPFYLIAAAGLFMNPETYRSMIGEFFENPALAYIGGIIALVMGLLILNFHSGFGGGLAAIKGAVLIIRPATLSGWSKAMIENTGRLRAAAVFALILGLFLTVKGYGIF